MRDYKSDFLGTLKMKVKNEVTMQKKIDTVSVRHQYTMGLQSYVLLDPLESNVGRKQVMVYNSQ